MNTFDFIAPWYDAVASLVFGKVLLESQFRFYGVIPPNARVLILGGGSGKFLKTLFNEKPNIEIWYVDTSSKMLRLASADATPQMKIHFIHGTVADVPDGYAFDTVITAFFLDMFNSSLLEQQVDRVRQRMVRGGIWLVTDFVSIKWWHRILLVKMFLFFALVAGMRIFRLADWQGALKTARFRLESEASYCHGFIRSALYRREE